MAAVFWYRFRAQHICGSSEIAPIVPSVTTPFAGLQTTLWGGKAKAPYEGYYLVQPHQAKLHNKVHMGSFRQILAKLGEWAQTPRLPHYCVQWDSVASLFMALTYLGMTLRSVDVVARLQLHSWVVLNRVTGVCPRRRACHTYVAPGRWYMRRCMT